MVRVSIITVCFNSAKTIEQTIQSVMQQTYKKIEYIIIDGGSTDGTIDIIAKYKDDIACFISEPDDGLYYAMNKGLDRASGDIIGIINSDDWYSVDAVEKVVRRFVQEQPDIVHGDVVRVSEWGNVIKKPICKHKEDLYHKMIYNHPTVFVRRDVYMKYGNFNCRYRIAADYELLLRFYRNRLRFAYEASIISFFRTDGLSETKCWKCVWETRKAALDNLELCQTDREKHRELIARQYDKGTSWALKNFFYRRMKKITSKNYIAEAFQYFLPKGRKYVIFGTGIDGMECYQWAKESGVSVNYFLDNSVMKQGKSIDDIIIKPPCILKDDLSVKVIVATSNYKEEVMAQLETLGLIHGEGYVDFDEVQQKAIREYIRENLPTIYNAPAHFSERK